tara:strand:- start:15113 stop:15349 length:237 start_codon:yes stop_codon:yes gene_type:complete
MKLIKLKALFRVMIFSIVMILSIFLFFTLIGCGNTIGGVGRDISYIGNGIKNWQDSYNQTEDSINESNLLDIDNKQKK